MRLSVIATFALATSALDLQRNPLSLWDTTLTPDDITNATCEDFQGVAYALSNSLFYDDSNCPNNVCETLADKVAADQSGMAS